MRAHSRSLFMLLIVFGLCALVRPADEERMAIFGNRSRVEMSVNDVNGANYVDLVQALAAEVDASATLVRNGMRIKAGDQQFNVQDGARTLRIRGNSITLRSSAIVKDNSVLVTADDLPAVLRAATRKSVLVRPGRIFIGETADFASTQLRPGEPSSLILNFRNAVNPRVTADAKTVTLTFDRDPAVLSAPQSGFDDKTIASVQSQEQNGSAAITVTGEVPLMVRFEDGNRRIVVTAAPAAAAVESPSTPATNNPPTAAPEAAGGASPVPATPSPSVSASVNGLNTAVVAIDPAHGGADAGVRFSEKLVEKEVTLELAGKIKAELTRLGISSVVLRNSDEDRSGDERAEIANGAHVNFYVGVHAGQGGTGVRLYTAMPSAPQMEHGFAAWTQVQSGFAEKSAAFAAAMSSQLAAKKISARQLYGNAAPVGHVAAAAVLLEIAPEERNDDASLESQNYQQRVAQAVAAAVAGERSR